MKHLERDFWHLTKGKYPGEHERIENAAGNGITDVYGTYEKSYFVELKATDNVKEIPVIKLLRDTQIIWHKKHGRQGAIIFVAVKYPTRIIIYQYMAAENEYKEIGRLERRNNRSYDWDVFRDIFRFAITIS